MNSIRIAMAQVNSTVGDLEGNLQRISAFMRQAEDLQVDLLTFPELVLCGYPPEDLLLRPGFIEDCRRTMHRLAAKAKRTAAVVGFPHLRGEKLYNAAAVIQAGRVQSICHKVELPNYGVFDEKRYFSPGRPGPLFKISGAHFMVTICEDIWVPDSAPERLAQKKQPHFVLNISASPFHAGKLAARTAIAQRFARRTGAILCFNNLVGAQDEVIFDGGAFILDPEGRPLARAPRFCEELLVYDLHLPVPAPIHHATDQQNQPAVELKPFGASKRGDLQAPLAAENEGLDEIYQALMLGTADYVRKNGFRQVVLGLSGGIDSSLTAAVAVDALGAGNVIGVTMPSRYTSPETRSDAQILAENLGIHLITVPVQPVFEAYLSTLHDCLGEGTPGVAHENLQARIRGNYLMALSNRYGWLVLTTGNKSETAVGYCTLYGDMAGGFAVIKDIPKTLVFRLARHVNQKHGRSVIPESVIRRPPSAELRPNQRDEDSLPPYEVLDRILERYVEQDQSVEDIIAAGFAPGTVTDVVRMVDRSEYKRRQAAPGIKITPKAFGKDRRLPITNRYRQQPSASS